MSLHCSSCDHVIVEEELRHLGDGAKFICTQYAEFLILPEMTILLSFVSTAKASRRSSLEPTKKFALLVLAGIKFGKFIDIEVKSVTIGREGYEVLLEDVEIS